MTCYLADYNEEVISEEDAKLKVEEKVKEKDFKYGACFDIEKEFRNSKFKIYQNNTWENLYKET